MHIIQNGISIVFNKVTANQRSRETTVVNTSAIW